MKNPQFTIDEILTVVRRRRKIFLLPFLAIFIVCLIGAFLLPRKYESQTTILVQRDDVLNPLVSYTMAVALASDDRLKDFNEIIFSRPTIESLIDSLGLTNPAYSDDEKNEQIKSVTKNIETELRGSDSYTIHYFDPIPARAQKAVQILSEFFIAKKLEVNNRRNEFTVEFFEKKLEDLKNKFEVSQGKYINVLKESETNPGNYDTYAKIEKFNSDIGKLDETSDSYSEALNILRNNSDGSKEEFDVKNLYNVALLNVPYSTELESLLKKYESLSQKYTPMFPDVQDVKHQILEVIERMKHSIEAELSRVQDQTLALEKNREESLTSIRSAAVEKSQSEDVKSTYDLYSKIYDDMKIKLEQARTTRDLGKRGGEQFIVIDPPHLPTSPAKPNKPLIISGGFVGGLFIGFLFAAFTELFDTRIRTQKDIEVYEKPILAFLPSPGYDKKS